nr:nickel transporter permease [Haladaptatus cibarius]
MSDSESDAMTDGGVVDETRFPRYRSAVESRAFRQFTANKLNIIGLVIVVTVLFGAVFAPVLTTYNPEKGDLFDRLEPPSEEHLLGTDQLGRDVFARLLYGARISLGIAVTVVGITLVIGTAVGVTAGYAGGYVDEALMRFVDILLAFPGILLALVIAGILGPSLTNIMIALAVVGWTQYARVVRGSVLSVKEMEYVRAAQLMGVSRTRIVLKHIIPNVIAPVVVLGTMDMAYVILGTAGLSFLGLGAQPPTPEWGTMLASGRNYLQDAWWVVNFPGLAIMLVVLGFNLLGDGLRDLLDPKDMADMEDKGL